MLHYADLVNDIREKGNRGVPNMKKIMYETWARWYEGRDYVQIIHFSTVILDVNRDGSYTIYGGWLSVTDIMRIRRFADVSLWSLRDTTVVYHDGKVYPFFRGIRVGSSGKPLNVHEYPGEFPKAVRDWNTKQVNRDVAMEYVNFIHWLVPKNVTDFQGHLDLGTVRLYRDSERVDVHICKGPRGGVSQKVSCGYRTWKYHKNREVYDYRNTAERLTSFVSTNY